MPCGPQPSFSLPPAIRGNVTALLALSPRDIWVDTYQNGLCRWNPHTNFALWFQPQMGRVPPRNRRVQTNN